MNAVYKLIWNVSTGTWAVAHELAASRGKKTGRSRLAAAMAVALALPAGAALAADSPDALQCAVNETVSADGLRCEATASSPAQSRSIGTQAALDDAYIKVRPATLGGDASAVGNGSIAIGSGAKTVAGSGGYSEGSIALGGQATATSANAVAIGFNASADSMRGSTIAGSTAVGAEAKAEDWNATALGYGTNAGEAATAVGRGAQAMGVNSTAMGIYAVASASGSVAAGRLAKADGVDSVSLGREASVAAAATGSVALGSSSVADEANTVSVGNATTQRRIVNMAAGTADTDAVNISQLSPIVAGLGGGASIDDITGVVTGPTYNFGSSGSFNDVGAALGNLDGRVDSLESAGPGGPGLVERDATTGDITVANKEVGGNVSIRDANGDSRKLTGVRGGTDRTDAANFGQLSDNAASVAAALGGGSKANPDGTITAPGYSIGGSDYANVGDAFGAVDTSLTDLDGRVGTVEGNVTNLQTNVTTMQGDITNLTNGTLGIVKYDAAGKAVNVAADLGGDTVNFAGTDGDRTLAGVKAGVADTDAANVGQLKGTAQSVAAGLGGGSTVNADGTITAPSYSIGGSDYGNVGDAFGAVDTSLSNLDGRVTVNEGNITTINNRLDGLADGTVGLVTYDAAFKDVNVAAGKDGTKVNFAGTDGERTLAGVKAGVADTDAANVGQLKGTAQSVADGLGGGSVVNPDGTITAPGYSVGGTTVGNVGDAITNIDGRVTTNTGDITNLTDVVNNLQAGGAGMVTYDAAAGTVNVASTQAGSVVNFAGTAGDRTLSGVAAGKADNDAANMGQVKDVVAGLGGGATVNPDGTITGPSYSIGGSDYSNVGDAFGAVDTSLTNLDGRVTVNEGNISNLTQQFNDLSNGAAGIVTYDAAAGAVNVAAAQAGSVVNMAGTDGNRVIAGVAEGKVEAGSDEAVNGSQLNETNERVSVAETNISNLDARVTTSEGDITNLNQQVTNLSNGSAGLVTQDATTGDINVASQLGGAVVNVAGTDGARRLSGVANGVDDTDAVTIAQLKASGLVDPNDGRALGALVYDDMTLDRATLGGTNGTVIGNLGNGLIAAGSREAVNGGQLFQMNADWEAKWSQLDGRVGTIEQGIADGSIGGPGSGGGSGGAGDLIGPGTGENSLVVGEGSLAGGDNSTSVGNGSSAGGNDSVAIGSGSSATGENSVAIGNGSVADRDNEVSVGSEGNERVISNVAAGTRPTDAVNVQQMEDRFKSERDWAEGRFHAVDKRIDRMGAISAAYAGMAINTAGLEGDNRVGAGVGSQNGRSALAVGYQRILGEKKNVSVSLGGAFSGSDKSVSAGAGFSW